MYRITRYPMVDTALGHHGKARIKQGTEGKDGGNKAKNERTEYDWSNALRG